MKDELLSAPIPTLRRLPRYNHVLKKLIAENVKYVSATTIANILRVEPIQVRKDLSLTGIVGKPKKGYEINELVQSIRNFLNWNNQEDAFLVGVGALGEAILGYKNFKNYGLNIVAAFETDNSKIGNKIQDVEIFNLDKLSDLIERMHINIGVITTPSSAAQSVADIMIAAGVEAIWNFAPVALKVPEEVILENVHLSQSLAVLTHKLAKKLQS